METTLHFGIEEQDDVDNIIDTILHSAPIHSVYGNVVDDHHVVDVYPVEKELNKAREETCGISSRVV